jgi:hypothetical protein
LGPLVLTLPGDEPTIAAGARAETVEEAWWRAVQQAEAVGMIGRGENHGQALAEGSR